MSIDQKNLDFFQAKTEYLQVVTNKNCYYWAYVFTQISGMLIMAIIALDFASSDQTFEAGMAVAFDNIILIFIAAFELMNLNKFKELSNQNKPNPHKLPDSLGFLQKIRFVFFVVAVFDFFTGRYLNGALLATWGIVHYLEDCVPLPPNEADRRRSLTMKSAQA